jgi:hypothetical protein
MPHKATVFRWLSTEQHKDFRNQYIRARDVQADVIFDEMLDIADTPVIGLKTTSKPTGVETVEGDMIDHRRLQIETRKWLLGKMAPKKYSDKQIHEHAGPEPQKRMTLHSTRSAPGGTERLACDVTTKVEPPPRRRPSCGGACA